MAKRALGLLLGIFFLMPIGAEDAPSPVKVGPAQAEPATVKAGGTFTLRLPVQMVTPWHIYPLKLAPDQVGLATEIKLDPKGPFKAAGEWREPRPGVTPDGDPVHEGKIEFTAPVKLSSSLSPGPCTVSGTVRYQTCDENSCLPPADAPFSVEIMVEAAETPVFMGTPSTPPDKPAVKSPGEPSKPAAKPVAPLSGPAAPEGKDLWSFLLLAIGQGLVALLLPCVYPMIPITVSFFTKEAEKRHTPPVGLALIYALGIVIFFTGIGLAASVLAGPTQANRLAANPWVNGFVALTFLTFALSLFGMFEIRMPSFLVNAAGGQGKEGVLGVLMMGFTFSLASFACTVAFVGNLLVVAAQGKYFWPVLGMAVFSATMALPFFCLSLFPSALKKMPRSGEWMETIKVVFGFVELAAAMKFISAIDTANRWEILTAPVILSVWAAVAVAAALYLFGVFRFSHEAPREGVSVPRAMWGMLFLWLGIYLGAGAAGAPVGGFIGSFLPPEGYGLHGAGGKGNGGHAALNPLSDALDDYEKGLAEAKKQGKPLFLYFSGFN